MSERTVLAPGKLVLLGEYAVLDGAPALVLAIDRGVRCDITLGGPGVQLETPDGDTRFVAPALSDAPVGRYRFDAWNPVDLPGKPGFGGSAAACVAACVAAGRPATDALKIHHAVQGSGSGVDVLASIHGGMGRAEGGTWTSLTPVVPVVTFAGQSARTGPRVQQYCAWSAPMRSRFVDESRSLLDRFEDEPIDTFRAAWRLLVAMAEETGIAYTTPAIERIALEAEAVGGAAKPSGAGGGDCTVALFPSDAARRQFQQRMHELQLPCIPVKPARGAHMVTHEVVGATPPVHS